MQCISQHVANVVLIRVEGRIDHTTAPDFGQALTPHVDSCTGEDHKLLLDCSRVDYMSSAGLRVLMIAAKRCRTQQGEEEIVREGHALKVSTAYDGLIMEV